MDMKHVTFVMCWSLLLVLGCSRSKEDKDTTTGEREKVRYSLQPRRQVPQMLEQAAQRRTSMTLGSVSMNRWAS